MVDTLFMNVIIKLRPEFLNGFSISKLRIEFNFTLIYFCKRIFCEYDGTNGTLFKS